ncbi:sugar ABC transporter permease [Pseudoclavibacter sp. RFBJ3]|uniref:carbohydrate ABC transporter permease n=1 Tax=unclassified Pseudoclavibacter TaxID=2615177 RepID=UPI000CE8B5CE|nr:MULTISPECIES: sugar ABC transporter permease [unclassified Pseudoclavibacter]MBF4458162.1 sugar ABC transporter permease [Pseudoclavibacter sp. VKM Ac-2867]MBF4549261.1 sugar ABC transporter permease [Pseudoclavibacter sp. VKM Ac-2888]PPF40043.1 sugar ABC transporter permease [Pseudoclavibacter sp. AY1H1]PPF75955.1 sugar ABC transporter permease [Pseudoclavibacter sp. Z016]PPF84951.1 sugar ABC transporter permease [Pseudoclavibacter sp. RFBJ5]
MASFFTWLAQLPPLLQVPIVIIAFLAVVALIVYFVELAPRPGKKYTILRLVVCIAVPVALVFILGTYTWAAIVAILLGALLFWFDQRSREGAGYLIGLIGFLAPALILVIIGLIVPSIQTTGQAFTNKSGDFVGLENFIWIFTQPSGIRTVLNTIIWVVVTPILSTVAGLAYAVFIDKSRGEKFLKALVFMPMAISFVGASIIFRFMYTARPADQDQIGLLNQIIVWFGGQPYDFLAESPLNTFFLIIVLIWVQTGFAMVVLSAAIKGVPMDQIEAASLDGANPWQRFINVTVPGIRSSLVVVVTTISIASLKVFDIVRTMTAGANDTSVIANEMYTQFKTFETGRSAAFAVVLFILVLPIIIYNANQMKKQREIR